MPKPSTIAALPADIRAWLDKSLSDNDFAGYGALEAALRERGYEISKSAIHRWGKNLKETLRDVKATTEAVRLVRQEVVDSGGEISEGLAAIIQTDMFRLLVRLRGTDEAEPKEISATLASFAHAASALSRSSVAHSKWQKELAEKATKAADAVERVARSSGLDEDTLEVIRNRILGIAA